MKIREELLRFINDISKKEGVPTLMVVDALLRDYIVIPRKGCEVIEKGKDKCLMSVINLAECDGPNVSTGACGKSCATISQVVIVKEKEG